MLGIMLGVVALITVLSVMNGFHKEVRERILGMTSHAVIGAYDGELTDWEEAMRLAKEHPSVIAQAPFVEAQTMLTNGGRVSGAMLRGILPEFENQVSDVSEHMIAGSLELLVPKEYGIVLGKELAYTLGVGPGDKVTVVTPRLRVTPAGAMPRLKRFTVRGIFEVGMGEYDSGVALVHLRDSAALLNIKQGVTGVRLKLDDLYEAPRISRELANRLPGVYRVSDWTYQHRNFFSALRTEKRMMGLILFLIVAVAAFLGASPGTIMGVFIIQGATIGIAGTLLGVLGGVALSLNLEQIVQWIEHTFGFDFLDPSIYYISTLPSDLHWDDVGIVSLSAFVITLLATLYPAWRASRVQPADALRYE